MSITKSYNKQNDTYYAYETQYVYDEAKQRKVQKRHCIGKYDPVTKEIIPTAQRGRPVKKWSDTDISRSNGMPKHIVDDELLLDFSKMSSRLDAIESLISDLTSELNSARSEYSEMMRRLTEKRKP